ncbi:NAD(P)H-dependent oxidoreductase [soil metagenome]
MNLFRLDASIRIEGSVSRQLADVAEAAWLETHPSQPITRRDIGTSPLPADVWGVAAFAGWVPEEDRTDAQRTALSVGAELADELIGADAYVFALPLYNFGVSQHVKTWIDLVLTDARFSPGVESPLAGRPASLIVTRGGGYSEGTPKHGWDHATPYYRRILGEQFGLDLHVSEVELTLADVNPAMESLRPLAKELLEAGTVKATSHGKILAERVTVSA